MESESTESALSPAVTRFVICAKSWSSVTVFTVLELGHNIYINGPLIWLCIYHSKGWMSLYGTRVQPEISCVMDQSLRWTYLLVQWRSKSPTRSGSIQNSTSKNTENPWSPAIISEHQPSCPFPPLIWLMHQNFIHHLTKISDTEAEDQQNLVIPPLQVDNIV